MNLSPELQVAYDRFKADPRWAADAVIYVYAGIEELKKLGLIEGGMFELSDEGRASYEALVANGFELTPAETELATALLMYREKLEFEKENAIVQ